MAKRLRARPSNTLILLIGSALVLVLVAVAGLNRPLPSYLIAMSNLPPGSELTEANSKLVQLDLKELGNTYAQPSDASGLKLLQPVAAGELVPLRILGESPATGQTAIRFTPELKPASLISIGSRVVIWQVVENEGLFESQLLVPSALVTDIAISDGLFAGENPEVEVFMTESEAALLLSAIASEAAIYLLPRS